MSEFLPVDDILEWVIKFIIKQAIEQSPQIFKKLKSSRKNFPGTILGVSKSGLIDRDSEQRQIQSSIKDNPNKHVLYFYGPGGIGKTRLLEETEHWVNSIKIPRIELCWTGIIDLYHTEYHSILGIQSAIVQGLDPQEIFFKNYRNAIKLHNQKKVEGMTSVLGEQDLDRLENEFKNDFKEFSTNHRSVIALDTVECIEHGIDIIHELYQLSQTPLAIRDWIFTTAIDLPNTVLILAGRSQRKIIEDLEVHCENVTGHLEIMEMRGFTSEDSRLFLEKHLKQSFVKSYASEIRQKTAGIPVYLALVVELLMQDTLVEEPRDQIAVEKQLVNRMFRYESRAEITFFLIALARKGLTVELMRYLQPELLEEDCHRILNDLKKYTIIKSRQDGEFIFLHDAIYELFDKYPPPEYVLRRWYRRFSEFYRAKQSEVIQDINRWNYTITCLLYYDLQQAPLRTFQTDYIYWNEIAIKGHDLELDMQLRNELLSFISVPTNQERAKQQGLTLERVTLDLSIRWLKRLLCLGRYREAANLGAYLLSLGPDEYKKLIYPTPIPIANLSAEDFEKLKNAILSHYADESYWGHILTSYGEALIYIGAGESHVSAVIKRAITLLKNRVLDSHEDHTNIPWMRIRSLGRAYDRLGYLARTNGHYGVASDYYRQAISAFEKANISDELAFTLNNLSFICAILGQFEVAESLICRAVDLRLEQGYRYPIALSYNTQGLISAMRGDFESAWDDSLRAFSNFTELRASRGIGLVHNAQGYIQRQQGQTWEHNGCSQEEALDWFRQAIASFEKAELIFNEQVNEPIRLWETKNELGSTYYEQGILLKRRGDSQRAEAAFDKSISYQNQALNLAQEKQFRFQVADTLDDLAQVSAECNSVDEGEVFLEQALRCVPREFILFDHVNSRNHYKKGEYNWLILGKAYFKQGSWKIQRGFEDSSALDRCIDLFVLAYLCLKNFSDEPSSLKKYFSPIKRIIQDTEVPFDEMLNMFRENVSKYPFQDAAFLLDLLVEDN